MTDQPIPAPAMSTWEAVNLARDLVRHLEFLAPRIPPDAVTVTVSWDQDTPHRPGRPLIDLAVDNSTGDLDLSGTMSGSGILDEVADQLDLTLTDVAPHCREWTGQAGEADVALVLYLPDPEEDRTRVDRARDYLRQLGYAVRHDPALNATLAATALLGAGAALAARRALTR